jgi:SRSO17 transposase
VAAYASYVNLGFNHGAELADPDGLLAGSGARIRHVRIAEKRELASPALRRLVRAAVAQGRVLAPARGGGVARVRPTTGAKRRPRRSAR